MTKSHILALTLILTGAAAYAADMAAMDGNGDGMIDVGEFASAYPDADPALFAAVDVNGDGMIDVGELETATGDGGLLAG